MELDRKLKMYAKKGSLPFETAKVWNLGVERFGSLRWSTPILFPNHNRHRSGTFSGANAPFIFVFIDILALLEFE